MDRRTFLALVAGAAVACSADIGPAGEAGRPVPPPELPPGPRLGASPFTLGVASGDPLANQVILWTRLTGAPDVPVPVAWEVAADEDFTELVAAGVHVAEPSWGHSVHADAGGLRPDTRYHYRFRVGGQAPGSGSETHTSPTGRTRTAPAAGTEPDGGRMRFGFASCQRWTDGHYSAYPHLVAEDLDLMVWLGDYIYESSTTGGAVRSHPSGPARTLDDYRARYALYTGDPQLQAARAAMPWLVLWDDHEVVNDIGGDRDRDGTDPAQVRARRAAAYQAWWENQPIRAEPPAGASLRVHRSLAWGSLAQFVALDERQYRSRSACSDQGSQVGNCEARTAPDRSMLGTEQRDWFLGELDRSAATWNVIANEVVMTGVGLAGVYNLDQWDGFAAERRTILERFAARPELNPLVITGDIHAFAVADLKVDHEDPSSPVVGTEIVGGSISSRFNLDQSAVSLVRSLPNVKLVDGSRRGYAVVELDGRQARGRLRAVRTVAQPDSEVDTLAELVVEAGRPGARLL